VGGQGRPTYEVFGGPKISMTDTYGPGTLVLEESDTGIQHDDPEIDHYVCMTCSPDTGLCGTDVSDTPWGINANNNICVVCADLVKNQRCLKCGEIFR
jgi:hypothetical protein